MGSTHRSSRTFRKPALQKRVRRLRSFSVRSVAAGHLSKDAQDVEEEVDDVEVERDGAEDILVGRKAARNHVDVVDDVCARGRRKARHAAGFARRLGARAQTVKGISHAGARTFAGEERGGGGRKTV
eukprot:6193387-Pleurochrysis_carterae.AAC.2